MSGQQIVASFLKSTCQCVVFILLFFSLCFSSWTHSVKTFKKKKKCVFLALPLIMFLLIKITRCWQPQSGQVASVPSPITQKHFATTLLQNDLAVTPSMYLFSSNRGGSLMTTSDICLLSLGRTTSSYYHHYHCIVTCSLLYIAEIQIIVEFNNR